MDPMLEQEEIGVPGENQRWLVFGRVKLANTLLTCDKGNFNRITAWEPESNDILIPRIRKKVTGQPLTQGLLLGVPPLDGERS